jgi:hypothetical protein
MGACISTQTIDKAAERACKALRVDFRLKNAGPHQNSSAC